MHIGTLYEVTDPFINAFVNENYNFMIKYLEDRMYLNESDDSESDDQKPQNKIDQFLAWLKKNAWQKPRAWFAKVLTKLNTFAAKIAHKEATRPGERSIWSKIKEKVAKAILWVSNKLENWVRPGMIGNELNNNARSMNRNELDAEVGLSKAYIDAHPDNKKKSAHIETNYEFAANAGEGDEEKKKKLAHYHEIHNKRFNRQMKKAFERLDQLLQQAWGPKEEPKDPETK